MKMKLKHGLITVTASANGKGIHLLLNSLIIPLLLAAGYNKSTIITNMAQIVREHKDTNI